MKYWIIAAAAALAACGPPAGGAKGTETPPAAKAAPNAATLKAATVAAEETPDDAASVNKVVILERGDAKFYSTVGGDPAINGEYVFLALMGDPAEGVKTFKVGDFNMWELVEQKPDSAVLKVSHSAVDQASGEIVTYEQKIAVNIPGFEATSVSVTPVD